VRCCPRSHSCSHSHTREAPYKHRPHNRREAPIRSRNGGDDGGGDGGDGSGKDDGDVGLLTSDSDSAPGNGKKDDNGTDVANSQNDKITEDSLVSDKDVEEIKDNVEENKNNVKENKDEQNVEIKSDEHEEKGETSEEKN